MRSMRKFLSWPGWSLVFVLMSALLTLGASQAGKTFVLDNLPTTSLPAASTANQGGLVYDTTVKAVKVSNGSSWNALVPGAASLTYGGSNYGVAVSTSDEYLGGAAQWPAAGKVAGICYTIEVAGAGGGNYALSSVDITAASFCSTPNIACNTAAGHTQTCLWVADGGMTGAGCTTAALDIAAAGISGTGCATSNPLLSATVIGRY